jgi:putative membrane-bound dehydrogenase-like protein
MYLKSWLMLLCGVSLSVIAAERLSAEEEGFRPIFDGQSLKGWKAWPGEEAYWRVENGVLIGESTAERPLKHNSFLVWEHGSVDDFELRLQFRITGDESANSGIQFRGTQREDGHVIGYQADIDRKGQWLGCLYDEAQRGVLATRGQKVTVFPAGQERQIEQFADAAELFRAVNINDWNDYTIRAEGPVITLSVNGRKTVEVIDRDPAGYDPAGMLALQLHSGPAMKIEWRNIRLKRLPLSEGRKKIVFIAGRPSHGYMSHEHNAGCLLLASRLNAAATEHGLPVLATVYRSGWPQDATALDNADCVVSYCDGGGGHYLNDRLADFDHLVQNRHVGLVCLHYAVETTAGTCGEHFLKWIGGYFEPHWSVNPHWDAEFTSLPEHPITRGVPPFKINDEWYYHMRFVPEMKNVTPILTALPPRETLNRPDGPHSGNPHVRAAVLERQEPQHTAWAYERPDGTGRGFGFTGGHFHRNWQDDNFRKLVLNAIVWAAQLEVPSDGVPSRTPDQEEMEANQDFPKPGTAASPPRTPRGGAGNSNTKPVVSSPVVTPQTPGHAVNIEADITGAKSLFLVVTDGGNGFGCDWADWAEPRLVAGTQETRLTELKWKAASADFGDVQVGKNVSGGALKIAGQPVEYGIGTHANSIIEYELPAGHAFTKFVARGGLDNGGTDQPGCGAGASVQFHVFTDRPGRQWLAQVSTSSGGAASASHEAADAVEQLDVHPALSAHLFASEPMMTNPAAIDIDHLGRVWVCEAINYRAFRNQDVIGDRQEGDRILVLQDTNGDARADRATVFYQGHDVDSAHGILILPTPSGKGLRALVSALDSVFFLIDDDGDLKADRKELLFTGIDGAQHDHGIHAFHFGPDGKLYFNFGNAGRRIKDKQGRPIIDKAGNEVNDSRKPYQEGMVFRCNLDGSEFETLGWNFRNNWEVCVDSFGTMWQSDNDDDGNRGVRINYVMEYGNYGYRDEITGAGWNTPRTNWETEIPLRHWHLNDPGVVPNLLQTGAGAPTGICLYEGDLLPMFKGHPIHCDAGPNICRAYITRPYGAGYQAEIVDILDGTRNKWFRPSDVCVAPDGSLLIADWYDPGVGGHRMQDKDRGRIFRVTPQGDIARKYVAPTVDVSTVEGAIAALKSPNMSARYLGWTALQQFGRQSVPALEQLWKQGEPIYQARALGVLAHLGLDASAMLKYLAEGLQHPNPNIRCWSIRLARQNIGKAPLEDVVPYINLTDSSPAVRREYLIAIRELLMVGDEVDGLVAAWVALAQQYDGTDRWYLEALGIAADGHWDLVLEPYLASLANPSAKPARDIIWRSRSPRTPTLLARLIKSPATPKEELPRLLRAFDFQSQEARNSAILDLSFVSLNDPERTSLVNAEALNRLNGFDINTRPDLRDTLLKTLEASRGTERYIRLIEKFSVSDRYPELLAMAQAQPETQLAVEAVKALFNKDQRAQFKQALQGENRETVAATIAALATAQDGRAVGLLKEIMQSPEADPGTRREAVKGLAGIRQGAVELQKLAEAGELDGVYKEAVIAGLQTSRWQDLREFAAAKFPLPPTKDSQPLPPISELATRSGDVANGRIIFNTTGTCNKCHQVNGIGLEIGPNLSEIGKKLTKEALLESILYPSAAISHNYETWTVLTEDGQQYTGLLVSDTADGITLKDDKGILRTVAAGNVEAKKKQDISLMPADVQKLLTQQELLDLVEYLTTLKERRQ